MNDNSEIILTLLTLNDVDNLEGLNNLGGKKNIEKIIKKEKKNSSYSILTVNGDFLGPSFSSSLSNGQNVVHFFNQIGIDYVVVGNHEFDYGVEILKSRINDSQFDWLGTNIRDRSGDCFPGLSDYSILNIQNIKIGVFGICTEDAKSLSHSKLELEFLPALEVSKKMVQKLKKLKVDIVIALTHQSLEDDIKLAREINGIDVILGGHDHFPVTVLRYGTLIHKSGSDCKYLGRIDLHVNKHNRELKIFPAWKIIPIKNKIKLKQKKSKKTTNIEIEDWLQKEVYLSQDLDVSSDNVKTSENGLGNLIADFAKKNLRGDISLINAGFIRGDTTFKAGATLTLNDLIKIIPFNDRLVLLEITGKELRDILEWTLSNTPDPSKMFPHVSGIKIVYDSSKPKGQKIKTIFFKGKPLNNDRKFKFVTLDFLHSGGDNIVPLANATLLPSESLTESIGIQLSKIIAAQDVLNLKLDKRIIDIHRAYN